MGYAGSYIRISDLFDPAGVIHVDLELLIPGQIRT